MGSTDHNLYAVDVNSGTLKWKFTTNGRVNSSPAVVSGVVYFGSYDANFYAVDAVTGKLKWKFKTKGERRYAATHLHGAEPAAETVPDPFDFYLSPPAVEKRTVYFGSGDGKPYGLDASSGVLRGRFRPAMWYTPHPRWQDGTLFVGSWDSYFYALDAKRNLKVEV